MSAVPKATPPDVESVRPGEFVSIELAKLRPSPTNPRKFFDKVLLDELAKNIRDQGLHSPILVRPGAGKLSSLYEIVAGERRFRAAQLAGLTEVLCRVRPLTDVQVLEIQVIENMQRSDLTPLEEAGGYQALMNPPVLFDVQKIADRVGRSIKYVYDRVKLLELVPAAKKLLERGKITAGHAILLARLKPQDQERAISAKDASWGDGEGSIFERRDQLFDDDLDKKDPYARLEVISVRETDVWIARNVRLDVAAPATAELFPDTATAIARANEKREKVVHITHERWLEGDAQKGAEKILGPNEWKPVDGKKTCEHVATGVVVIGEHQGETLRVCTATKACKMHWAKEQREQRERAAVHNTASAEIDRKDRERRQREVEREKEAAARWKASVPVIRQAIAEAVKKAPATAKGRLGDVLVRQMNAGGYLLRDEDAEKLVPRGSSAEDLVRHLAFAVICRRMKNWNAQAEIPRLVKPLGVDVAKILAAAAKPKEKAATPTPAAATKKARKK